MPPYIPGFSRCFLFSRVKGGLTACATVEKKPFRMRAARYELKLVAAPHQAEVPKAMDVKESKTGSRPKQADRNTVNMPPAPKQNRLPTKLC